MTKPETRMTNQCPMIKCPNVQTKEFLGIKTFRNLGIFSDFGFRASDLNRLPDILYEGGIR